ncbi:hypothetical protein H5410_013995 [Solanum commersonii]|uniref:Uncharacterized protein n=1 Tax=Solanum commersonii TaxID=4109 RepID=A0A9J5ZPY7_SOLCO|nr:hypothetical protein H5410_013995 [Solanum commersonii]
MAQFNCQDIVCSGLIFGASRFCEDFSTVEFLMILPYMGGPIFVLLFQCEICLSQSPELTSPLVLLLGGGLVEDDVMQVNVCEKVVVIQPGAVCGKNSSRFSQWNIDVK